ncbi:MAG: antA/AntB antirepressor family protein [Culicoidibacterales bacterium]
MDGNHQVDGTQTILASELHKFLGVPTRFNDWIKRLIIAFEFEEGKDYYSFLSMSQAEQAKYKALSDK